MNVFKLSLASPDGIVFEGEAEMLSLRGEQGDLAVMAGHAPFMTTVMPGNIKLCLPDGTERTGIVRGGLLSVGRDKTRLLCSGLEWD